MPATAGSSGRPAEWSSTATTTTSLAPSRSPQVRPCGGFVINQVFCTRWAPQPRQTLNDPGFAWNLAHSLALDSDQTWSELVKAYEKVDPIATLPIHQRLVENELVEAGAQHWRLAARRLARMRKLADGSELAGDVDGLIADLRETHRRRPRLQQEFDRAGLPGAMGL